MWGQGAVCIREFEEFSNCVQMIQSNADMCQAWQKKKKFRDLICHGLLPE